MKNIILLAALFLMGIIPAHAGAPAPQQTAKAAGGVSDPNLDKIQKIPDFSAEMPAAAYEAGTEIYEESPMGDRFLAYRVRLPKGWIKAEASPESSLKRKEMEKAKLSQRILGSVARYYGPGRIEEPSRFDIEAQALDFEVTARNWFMQEILVRGYVLEGLKVISDRRVEAQYVTVERDTAYVVRAVAEINGPRIVVASYYVPDLFWPRERVYQQKAIESFEFLSPEKTKIEMTRSYAFLDLVSFDYPASWRLSAPAIYSVDAMEAKLLFSPDSKTLGGEISISAVAIRVENSLADELEYIKSELTERGLTLGELLETKNDYKLPAHVKYNKTEIYKIKAEQGRVADHELWISVMEEDRYYYVVAMLTPGRESEFFGWARNSEAFQTVVESFRP